MVDSNVKEKLITTNKTKSKKEYLSTTELAKLCGVSRFTIINWTNQGKINAFRTVGGKYRIPVTEAISFLENLHRKTSHNNKNGLASDALGHCWEYPRKTNCDNRCKDCIIHGREVDYCFIVVKQFGKGVIRCKGDCLNCEYFSEFFGFYNKGSLAEEPTDENSKKTVTAKMNFMYHFAYRIGRSVHSLKRKSKVK